MSGEAGVLARITAAEGHIRNARQAWDPSSVPGCAECAEELQQATSAMQAALEATAAGPAPSGTRARLDRLRSDVEVLSRLVDAAIAFSRGLALRSTSAEIVGSEVRG